MLGHISLGVSELARSISFYDAALSALGFARVFTGSQSAGYGSAGTTNDRLLLIALPNDAVSSTIAGFHIAFDAKTKEAVDHFHAAALANGGSDNGSPGPRPHYGPDYYAAFVLDPDGYRLEAKFPPPQNPVEDT